MHTPEQAKQLWCPMSRVAQAGNVDIPVAYNRSLNKEHKPMRSVKADPDTFQLGAEPEETTVLVLTATPGVSMAANCIGDRCAMWRWGTTEQLPANAKPGELTAMERVPSTTHGYCGLAPLHQN